MRRRETGRAMSAAVRLAALAVCLLFAPAFALAQAFNYSVEMQVPGAQRKLLEDYLDIYKWRDNPRMNAEQLRLLFRKTPDEIRDLLATEGYFSPTIDSALEDKAGKWRARFTVEPGDPVRVASFDVQVRGAFADGSEANAARLRKLRERWSLPVGAIFRQAQWEDAKRAALRQMLTEGYPAAAITSSQATVDPEARKAVLEVVLDSGSPFVFGATTITGLKRYPSIIVERLNPIKPGSAYSQSKLLDFQARLQDSPYFSSAQASAEIDPARPDAVPVRVDVTERPSRKIGFGIGASTNTGARGQVEYQHLDFLNRAWRFTTRLKLETKKQALTAEVQVPRTALGYLDSANAFSERDDIEGEVDAKHGIGAKRMRVQGRIETALAIQYQIESRQIEGAESDRSRALTLNYSWTRRDVDNLLYPTRGTLFNAQLGGASEALLSDQNFVRTYAKVAYHRPLGDRGGLILRGELGATLARSRQGIPSDFLFRAGGDQSVRGFAYQSLGVTEGDAIVGGRYLGVASAEYVHWLKPNWGAAVFYDVGTAADQLHDLALSHGYGIGARWKSPVGPLNLDVAYGQEVQDWRLHFSVGFAF
jgi:translocation and assembly module TamA